MSEWISIEDKMPPIGVDILTWKLGGFHDIEECTDYDIAVLNGEEYSQTHGQFTHWMPLPEPPSE